MYCYKCGKSWKNVNGTNQTRFCPFCMATLIGEIPVDKSEEPSQVIKDIAEGKYGAYTIYNQEKCSSLFANLIHEKKDRNLLEILLKLGVADSFNKNSNELSDSDKEKLIKSVRDSLYNDYFSEKRLSEGINWFAKALLDVNEQQAENDDTQSESSQEQTLDQLFTFLKQIFNIELVLCPAGTFMMGSPINELGRFNWEIYHKVTISSDFYIARFPVTQALYKAVMGNNPSKFKGDNCPVERVNWFKAKEFCDRLNEQTFSVRPSEYRFDLPTEAQWEYACRAGTTTSLNSGKNIITETGNCSELDRVGWYYLNSGDKTHQVGAKKPNSWGIYDMHGNVWEWCRDWYGDYPSGNCIDPEGPETGIKRVGRGGGRDSSPRNCRSANRNYDFPGSEDSRLGFRLALVPTSKK